MQGCSNDDFLKPSLEDKLNFPLHIEKFGKAVANEIHQTVINLNERGVDYSNAKNTPEFKKQFYQDWAQASPGMIKTKVSQNQMFGNSLLFIEGYRNLTHIQIEFIRRILKECDETTSYEDFGNRLANINKDIFKQVPEIGQERLLYITSALYYGIGEIQNLEKQGQMLITPQTKFRMRRVKTRSESGGDGFWGTCRSIYSAVAPYVFGTLTEMGEIVVSVSEVMVGGVALIMSVLCVSDTDQFRAECAEKYRDCMDKKGPWSKEHSGGWGYTMCARCLEFCRAQHGVWDCPRPV